MNYEKILKKKDCICNWASGDIGLAIIKLIHDTK